MTTRLYLPLTPADVTTLHERGELPPARPAYGVSPALIAATGREDEEEREYLAFQDAVAAAGDLAGAQGRMLVLALDLPERDVAFAPDSTESRLGRPIARREAVSIHVGEEAGPDADLLWYDITELEVVAGLLV